MSTLVENLMVENVENSEQAVRYLLGELGEAERDMLEERLFSDEQFGLYLDAVEDDLVDEYVRGEMDPAIRQRFERSYLASERRRDKLAAAKILNDKVLTPEATAAALEKTSLWQRFAELFRVPSLAWASGLAAVVLLFLTGWLLIRQNNTPAELAHEDNRNGAVDIPRSDDIVPNPPDSQNTETEAAATPDSAGAPQPANERRSIPVNAYRNTAPSPARQPRIMAFVLLPAVRSGDRPSLAVPAGTETIRLQVVHDNLEPFIRYRAEIRDQSGDLIWSREIPVTEKTLSKPLVLNVRGAALSPGAFELTLNGITADRSLEEIKFYNFTIQKK